MLFVLTAGSAAAATISGVSIQGSSVRITADQKANYEVFDLADPARVVLNLPGARLAAGVEPLKPASGAVASVFPVQTAAGVKVEIGLDRKQPYKVVEQGNNLLVRFAAAARTPAKPKAAQAQIKDIEVHDSGSVTELVLHGSHMDASHDAFLTNKGQTMILDYWGATSDLPKDHYGYASQRVSGVTVGQAPGRVRLVVSLLPTQQSKYQVQATKDTMVVRFGNVIPKKKATHLVVDSVGFQPEDRISHIVVRTDQANPVINLSQKNGHVVIDVRKATLAAGQQRTQDVRDFPGPVKQIDSYTVGDHVRVVARLREKVEMSSFQQGNVLTVTLVPEDIAQAREGEAAQGEKLAYSGQKVTFDFQDIDIRNALRLIAEMSKLNIIMSDDVKGKLTMRLVDVPWDQALDLILSAEGLGKEQMGNVIRIAPINVLRAEYQAKLEAQQGSDQLEPLVTEFITLSYTKVADVKKMLDNASANSTRTGGTTSGSAGTAPAAATGSAASGSSSSSIGILSPRGSFLVDERTNTLIVKDTEESINNIKRLIAAIDKPVQQVLIESRIVEATQNFSRSFGIRWGGQSQNNYGGNSITIGGTQGGSSTTSATKVTSTGSSGYVVDMPASTFVAGSSGGAIGMVLGGLSKTFNLSLELSAAENNGEAKVISNPRLITSNLKAATISQGVSIPVTTPSTNVSPATVQYKQANLSLTVTPQITADQKVIMDIKVTKDAPSSTVTVNGNPGIDTKTIQTSAFLANGETVVIGGIYTKQTGNTVNEVPGLGDIPILGWLFKNKAVNDNRSELLIFLTPTIIQPVGSQGTSS